MEFFSTPVKKLLFPFHFLIYVLIATSFMQSLLLSVKRLRHVLIIFFKPEIICFLGGRAWGKEQVEEICTIFVEEKDLS